MSSLTSKLGLRVDSKVYKGKLREDDLMLHSFPGAQGYA